MFKRQIGGEQAGGGHHCSGVADGGENRSEDADGTSSRKHQRPGKKLPATGRLTFSFLMMRGDIFHDWPTTGSVIIFASTTNDVRLCH